METPAAEQPPGLPWLLYTWRTQVCDLTPADVGTQLFLSGKTVDHWEHGRRRVGHEYRQQLDDCFSAGGTFADMARATSTLHAFPPRRVWHYTIDNDYGPVWVWIRTVPGGTRLSGRLSWGVFEVRISEDCDERGLMVTCAISHANPTLRIELDQVGWVDIGRGTVPGRLGIPTRNAFDGSRVIRRIKQLPGDALNKVRPFDGSILRDLSAAARALGVGKDGRDAFLHDLHVHRPPTDMSAAKPLPNPDLRRARGPAALRIREARGFSRREAAAAASQMAPLQPSVGESHVRAFEEGRRVDMPILAARLDAVYAANGSLTSDVLGPSFVDTLPGRLRVRFPDFWVGPVWIRFRGPSDAATASAVLRWYPWQKPLRMMSGQIAETRRTTTNTGPLEVYCSKGWAITVGLGAHPGAVDVGEGWSPVDLNARARILLELGKGMLKFLKQRNA